MFSRPHAEHWKLWDLTFPSLSFMTCSLGSICSRGQELLYLGRLSSKCDPDGILFLELVNRPYLQSVKERMRRSFVWSRQVSTFRLAEAYVYPLVAPHLGRLLDTAHQLWRFARSSTCM